MAAAERRIGLMECVEDRLDLVGRDVGAGADHLESRAAVRLAPNRHVDAAVFGELHCVAGQVQQQLAQPRGVGAHPAGRGQSQCQRHGQALLGRRHAGQVTDRCDQGSEVELSAGEPQVPAFNLRKVEHIVDHREQVFAGALDHVEHVRAGAHCLAGRGRAQQARDALDAGQRRAHLVAHGRQELALHRAAGLRQVERLQCADQAVDDAVGAQRDFAAAAPPRRVRGQVANEASVQAPRATARAPRRRQPAGEQPAVTAVPEHPAHQRAHQRRDQVRGAGAVEDQRGLCRPQLRLDEVRLRRVRLIRSRSGREVVGARRSRRGGGMGWAVAGAYRLSSARARRS